MIEQDTTVIHLTAKKGTQALNLYINLEQN